MNTRTLVRSLALPALAAVALAVAAPASANHEHTTSTFMGAKVNAGTVTHALLGGKETLTLSDDFKVPETPDPHWQVVDSQGNVYLLQHLVVKGDKLNKSITLPAYVHDVAKVQIWCAYAEVVLGEASFPSPVK
ncbi:MAG TPA: hypothetical protein VFV19_06210 [Candidatus Polarisedimenticolaceae bacterium]|nr:hypothetical protein [Candidatus Polarisedimenticolaceae bacterium]